MNRAKQSGQTNSFLEVPCIIGIDQSYTRTGLAICVNGKLKKIYSIDFKVKGKYVKSKTMKRKRISMFLDKAIDSCLKHYKPEEINVICERVRTFTGSDSMRPSVIKAQAALVASIVDTAYMKGIRTYSVDTRAWKSRVLGTSRPIFEPIEGVSNPQKFGSVRKIIELGFGEELKIHSDKTRSYSYNDDMADAACIALYGFSGMPYSLLLEE